TRCSCGCTSTLSVIELLDVETRGHGLCICGPGKAARLGASVALLDAATLLSRLSSGIPAATPQRGPPRLHGVGAQIPRDLGIVRMALLASLRRRPTWPGSVSSGPRSST